MSGHVPPALAAAPPVAFTPAGETVQLAISLSLRHKSVLQERLQRIYTPGDPLYGHYLTAEAFTNQFAPTPAQYEAVRRFATASGLTITGEHANRLLLDVSAPAGAVEQAFQTRLGRFNVGGRLVRAPLGEPAVPAALKGVVSGVIGLDTLAVRKPHLRRREGLLPRDAAHATGSGPNGGLSPSDIRAAYSIPAGTLDGTGQTLGLFELDGYTTSDITTYENTFGLPGVPLRNVLIDGFNGRPGTGSDEVTLDIELQIALAPSATQIVVYEAPNTDAGAMDAYNRIATDNLAKEISTSWGLPETSSTASLLQSESQIFQQMAAQGQSIFAAAGDSGAYDDTKNLTVDDPASQPYVTGVGGTHLRTTSAGGSYSGESTWNNGSPSSGAGGGGISQFWSLPSYQSGVANSANKGSSTQRNVPDVSLDADPNSGYAIYTSGQWEVFGGTSCAAPLWSAFVALVNQQRASVSTGTLGFANPSLYTIGKGSRHTTDYHDVADGSTNLFYPAVTGYDLATGWGTIVGTNLLTDLSGTAGTGGSPPTLSNCSLTPQTLPASGGSVAVSVDVASTPGVSAVKVVVTAPAGTASSTSLTRVDSSSTWSGSVTLPANTSSAAASYQFTVTATDVNGNTSSQSCGAVTVAARDTAAPSVTSCQVTPASLTQVGGTVTVTATVTDPSGVQSVTASVSGPGLNTTITLSDPAGTYSGTFIAPANTTQTVHTYTVTLHATDVYNNVTTVNCGTVTVGIGDTTPPTIAGCAISPRTLPSAGGTVNISATVTDNVAVKSVTVTIVKPDGTTVDVLLTPGTSSSVYAGTFTAPANTDVVTQTYSASLRAIDTSSNSSTASCGTFTVAGVVVDHTRPAIRSCHVSPTSLKAAGGTVTITATATDNVAVATVSATITRPDGTTFTVLLSHTTGSTYVGSFTAAPNTTRKNQTYRTTLVAVDTANNASSVKRCSNVTVKHS